MSSSLLITCFSDEDSQFSGIRKTIELLNQTQEFKWIRWNHSKNLKSPLYSKDIIFNDIIITGHGSPTHARIGDNHGNFFTPYSLKKLLNNIPQEKERIPCNLYLICCYQGKQHNIEQWSRESRIETRTIFSTSGETETALSTLFFLHLLDDIKKGYYNSNSARKWFKQWERANRYLYPYFKIMRKIYFKNGRDPQFVIKELGGILFSEELGEFTTLYYSYPQFLNNLGS